VIVSTAAHGGVDPTDGVDPSAPAATPGAGTGTVSGRPAQGEPLRAEPPQEEVPRRLRQLEPTASLALAGHALAVSTVSSPRWQPVIWSAAAVLVVLGLAGLAGARSIAAVVLRGGSVLALGFLLQSLRADTSGYFLLWFFVLVSVYPLVLPRRMAVLVPIATPLGYLALVPLHAVDGSVGIAVLRALSLALIGVFVYAAAAAYRDAAASQDATRALLDTFLSAAPVGLAYWDADGRFRRVNRAFAELSDAPVADHLGRRPAEVEGLPALLGTTVDRVLAEGRAVFDVDLTEGEREWNSGFYPVRSSRGIAGVGAVLIEMTHVRAGARRLARSEAKAQAALTTLQTALLPADVTSHGGVAVAARYRAAGRHDQVGGDWYDTIPLPAGGLALVIGDVEGHDLTAASVMGLVRGAVRSYAIDGHPPSIVLQRVGAFLLSAGIERLVTMAYVQLYPGDTVATIAVGGHPAPLVVPHDGAAPWVLDLPAGPVLGVEGLTHWEEHTVMLPRDASLVLYTDGVAAGVATDHDELARLAATVPPGEPDPVNRLADVLISASPGHDDAAVLVARVTTGPAPSLRRTFPAQPISAGIARTWLADLFGLWTTSGMLPRGTAPADQQETAQLLLTELVSNAVRHSDESFVVAVRISDRRLRVDVVDTSERMPVMRRPEAAATEGRGLRLVDVLSSAWGVDLVERGKAVWFELNLGGTDEPVDVDRLLAALDDPGPF
jgi:serine phosphatase RsbU (regulator of sigma subunit)